MPEIWLRYGSTDVVLDIKFENLSNQISSNFPAISEEDFRAAVAGVPLTESMLVISLSASKAAARAALALAEAAHAKGFGDLTLDVTPRMAGALRSNLTALPGGEGVAINRAEHNSPGSLKARMSKFQSAVFISTAAYDPLFGYAGAPTLLLRNFYAEEMDRAFKSRRDNIPAPGEEGLEPLKIALAAVEGMPSATSVELVAGSQGIAGVHSGKIADAFGRAVAQLRSISAVETDQVKCAIFSASAEAATHSTLAAALNSLWNCIHIVKEGGTAILLAETRDGIGGGALQMFVEGKLKTEALAQSPYVDGLEHLMYLNELRQHYELGLVSTLPHYYAKTMLGFATYGGMKDIIEKLPEKHGKNYKALVVSDADITLLRPKA